MTRSGHTGERRCALTRETGPKSGLIRFVIGPDDTVVPDVAERLPGRGIWLSARRDVVETASAKGTFAAAARKKVRVPQGLLATVEALLSRRCLDRLGMARRSGVLVAGFEKVRAALKGGDVMVLVSAVDGSPAEQERLVSGLARGTKSGDVPRVSMFTAAELGGVLGRDHAVHIALLKGGVTDRFLVDAHRLMGISADGASGEAHGSAGINDVGGR